jgi:predicted dehydrogenase
MQVSRGLTMNVGLIGCGRVSELHMGAYRNIPEVKVVAVADINLERAKAFAQKHHISKFYDDTIKLFELKDLDFVDICTPISTHAKLSCEAAKHGHNIFLEKPMARSSKECDQIIHEITKNNVKLCICHNQLFLPTVLQAKKIIDSGDFSLAYFKVSVRESAELIGAPSWIMTPEQGGALWETGTHAAYLQLHFLKEIRKVCAMGEKVENLLPDHFIVMLTSPDKTVGVIEISWLAKKEEETFEFIDTKGRKIEIINYNFLMEHPETPEKNMLQGFYRDQKQIIKKWTKSFLTNISNRKFKDCVSQYVLLTKFIESIKNDNDPPVTPQEGRRTVRLLEYIEKSLNKNKPINVINL